MIRLPAFGLRLKLVLLSGFLFSIPWLGWEYVWEMEKFLRQGQERSLTGTVKAVATALHERPRLFERNASFLPDVEIGRDLYAYTLAGPIRLDGHLNDWADYRQHSLVYGQEHVIPGADQGPAQGSHQTTRDPQDITLRFEHMVGKFDRYLYAFFKVQDDSPVLRGENARLVDRNDYLEIAFLTPDEVFQRYLVTTTRAGWFTAYRLEDVPNRFTPVIPAPFIQGYWGLSEEGYVIELRIPLDILGRKIGFAITDVDQLDTTSKLVTIGTSGTGHSGELGTVLLPSPEIEQIIKGMRRSSSRLRVVDQHQRVLASAGDIRGAEGPWSVPVGPDTSRKGVIGEMERRVLHPIYDRLLTRPSAEFIDELENAALLDGTELSPALASALQGVPMSQWRLTTDKRAVILSAAHPIYIDEQVMGAVIAEETTNGIRSLRNRALEKLFNVMVAVMTLGTLALFIFASRISQRIRRLRNEAEMAIDDQGRITTSIEGSNSRDEIGDLSRSLADMVNRLQRYTSYLETMSSRLSHELRTPVAVVRSSLENMSLLSLDDGARVYMERAQNGLSRLNTILSNMSEATRLEQALQTSERVAFDLGKVVAACGEAYAHAYPNRCFRVQVAMQDFPMSGAPEHIAQLLDKLIANAVEFSEPLVPIELSLKQSRTEALLEVVNRGSCLPHEMQDRLFDAMVSVRPQTKQDEPHLGIGLHVARLITEFHHGTISAENLPAGDGVRVLVRFPLS